LIVRLLYLDNFTDDLLDIPVMNSGEVDCAWERIALLHPPFLLWAEIADVACDHDVSLRHRIPEDINIVGLIQAYLMDAYDLNPFSPTAADNGIRLAHVFVE
jgi:hypothetical protein